MLGLVLTAGSEPPRRPDKRHWLARLLSIVAHLVIGVAGMWGWWKLGGWMFPHTWPWGR